MSDELKRILDELDEDYIHPSFGRDDVASMLREAYEAGVAEGRRQAGAAIRDGRPQSMMRRVDFDCGPDNSGTEVTWAAAPAEPELRHEGSYVTVHAGTVARTVQIRPDLHVDLAADGRVIGVERIGAPVGVGDLAAVLYPLPFPPAEPVEEETQE